MSDTEKKVLDIQDRQGSFQAISERISFLNEGFRALYADYSHHIEVTYGKEHDILKLKENIDFRLFSSKFHLELLLRQHFEIEKRIRDSYKKNRQLITNSFYPSHPLFDYCEKEITSIFDSIVFHLASVYDYLSAIINFICNKKDRSITKWSQLTKSCRGQGNIYNKKDITKTILNENDNFVDKLYKYRSRIIHERADISSISLFIKVSSGETNVNFFVTQSLIKSFKDLKDKSQDYNITVSYVGEWLINMTIVSIANILFALKTEMEKMSTFPNHVGDDDLIFLYNDPETGFTEPVSKPMWKNLRDNIKNS